jgi:hypothetical protein
MTVTTTERPEPMTMRERYGRALRSHHLEMTSHTRGAVELLIAAGWVQETLGAMLYRLAGEYDLVRGDLDRARAYVSPMRAIAEAEEAGMMAGKVRLQGPTRAALYLDQAEMEERGQAIQARAFALLQLQTLNQTALALGDWACIIATREGLSLPDEAVRKVAGRALDAWLDARCDHCEGTGKRGAYGTIRTACRACSGTGQRSASLGRTIEEQFLARAILAGVDRMVTYVDVQMTRFLREHAD